MSPSGGGRRGSLGWSGAPAGRAACAIACICVLGRGSVCVCSSESGPAEKQADRSVRAHAVDALLLLYSVECLAPPSKAVRSHGAAPEMQPASCVCMFAVGQDWRLLMHMRGERLPTTRKKVDRVEGGVFVCCVGLGCWDGPGSSWWEP